MHGLKTIHQLNKEAAEAREICEKHGVALGDIPAPTGPLPEPVAVGVLHDFKVTPGVVSGGAYIEGYDLPRVDESGK